MGDNHSCHNLSRQNTFNGKTATCQDEDLDMNRRFEAYCSSCCSLDWGLGNTSNMSQALAEKLYFQIGVWKHCLILLRFFCIFIVFLYVTQSSTTQSVEKSRKERGTKKMSGLQSFQGNKSAISTEHRNMCWTCGAQVNKRKQSSSLSQREHKIWLTFKLYTVFFSTTRFVYHFHWSADIEVLTENTTILYIPCAIYKIVEKMTVVENSEQCQQKSTSTRHLLRKLTFLHW